MPPSRSSNAVFENYGGSYQLRLRNGDDLAGVLQLNDAFWVATSAPREQLTCDHALLERLDRDRSGRVKSDGVREACKWLLGVLKDRRGVSAHSDVLHLDTIDRESATGQRLHEAASQVLENLGCPDSQSLNLAQVRDRQTIFALGDQNGDGVIPPSSVADDAPLKTFIEDIMATVGSVEDLSGAPGVSRELLDEFLEHARTLLAWHKRSESAEDRDSLFPFGDATAERYALFRDLTEPVDAYFEQCRVFAVNELLGRPEEEAPCPNKATRDAESARAYLAGAPLARPRADETLPLRSGVNPHYADQLGSLTDTVLAPVLGEGFHGEALKRQEWVRVRTVFEGYESWLEAKSGGMVEALGPEKLRDYVEGGLPERLRAAFEADVTAGEELSAIRDLEYLILLQRWLLELCNNIVSFAHLYQPKWRAMFEAGQLVMGGRRFNLNLKVRDVAAHAPLAAKSGIYLLYSEVTAGEVDTPFFIATPVTWGRVSDLRVGSRGVLFDAKGKEWDTRVVHVEENPVSMAAAVAAPFKRLGVAIASTTERITTGAQQQLESRLTEAATTVETGIKESLTSAPAAAPAPADQAPAPAPPPGTRPGGLRDTVMAGSFAVAALGSSFAYIAGKFSQMQWRWWDVLAIIVLALAAVLVPTVAVAFFRLRRRNLSAVLEASGWAINSPMRLTRSLRKLLVLQPRHPRSIQRLNDDLTKALARTVRRDAE
jgi:hypothetical protein